MRYCILLSIIINIFYQFEITNAFISKILELRKNHQLHNNNRNIKMCIDTGPAGIDNTFANLKTSPGRNDDSWRTPITSILPINKEKISIRPELITFDAFGTLITPSQSIGRWYREALNLQTDMQIRLPRPALFTASFNIVLTEMNKKYPCFGALNSMDERDWWYQVVDQTYRSTTGLTNTIDSNELSLLIPKAFDFLYDDIFSTNQGWLIKDDTIYVLQKLIEWRDQGNGPQIGIISNFDSRLNNIINELGLDKYIKNDLLLNSYDCQSEKPSTGMFEIAMKNAGVTDSSKCFHIGDNINSDIVGAINAGWGAMRYNEWFDEDFPDWDSFDTEEQAEEGAESRSVLMQWGRKDSDSGLEWYELWGLDDVLTLFGFPEDDNKPIKTTYIRNYRDDY